MALSSVGAPPAAAPRLAMKRRAAVLAISLQCAASCAGSCATRSQVRCASCCGAAPAPCGKGPKDPAWAAPNPAARAGNAALAAVNQGPADCEVLSQVSNWPASGPASEDQSRPAPAAPAPGMPKVFSSSKKRSAALAKAASGLKPALVKGVSILYALRKTSSRGQ